MPAAAVQLGMAAALRAGSISSDVVAIEARKAVAAQPEPSPLPDDPDDPPPWAEPSGVVSLTARRAQIPEDRRPLPSVAPYDQFLTRRQPKGPA